MSIYLGGGFAIVHLMFGSVLYFVDLMKIRDWIYAIFCCPDGNNREKAHSALLFLKVPIFVDNLFPLFFVIV
jgi:hypothetical protein